jgi:hypothetical protein
MSTPCPVPGDPGSAGTSPGIYQRRRPERTVPYQAVQEHLETWLARQREADPEGDPIPAYVERDLRRYLECGIPRLRGGGAYWRMVSPVPIARSAGMTS